MTETHFIEIGLIVKPHGLRGEVCVNYFADSPFLLKGSVWLQKGKSKPVEHKVISSRPHKGQELLTLESCRDRNCAEELRNVKVLVPDADLPELTEEEVYLHQLEGMNVVLEDGTLVGRITAFQFNLGAEVWVITTEDKKEVLFPATEEFVSNIDIENETVTIAPPPGLLELYLSEK
ncbi:ribosome maturation factor RimM [Halodesulfovibrio marinisediminis]|uniref:Ribosome maturation factor RimM n=1 Tax=Halodesulfovibrio marinisediminis DSM 17456 TaxID=1121457 RepID=A0A1N6HEP2_9BACT|nr:ribosome maturation factor RimM [Halodesulfovibrio marinisediminis]SIO18230.1 16S rRNA processing protein RimM [Halodesulfovibrio marinisediminis DSM 17456]